MIHKTKHNVLLLKSKHNKMSCYENKKQNEMSCFINLNTIIVKHLIESVKPIITIM